MSKSRPYQLTSVKNVKFSELQTGREGVPCSVGLDVSKGELVACLRWDDGVYERPWKVTLKELPELVGLLRELSLGRKLRIAMEPSGVYGDPVRAALQQGGVSLWRVSSKASHDYAEVFDGVPSQHDGKDAATIAELASLGKCQPWHPQDTFVRELRSEGDWLDIQSRLFSQWQGRLEGLVSRHWPELTGFVKLSSVTLLKLLAHYGGPRAMASDPEAESRLRGWGRTKLPLVKVRAIIASARATSGLEQTGGEILQLQRMAGEALRVRRLVQDSRTKLQALVASDARLSALGSIVSPCTAGICWAHLGDPAKYHSPGAYIKAMGLNLKERSSGQYKGQLKLTKRGPRRVRRWLYFAAMRYVKKPELAPWYQARKGRGTGQAKRTLVLVMKKLARALYRAAQGQPFELQKLLPGARKYYQSPSKSPAARGKSAPSKEQP